MKHVKTISGATLKKSAAKGGCGECQTSCQSACKTSCTVANQKCENSDQKQLRYKIIRSERVFADLRQKPLLFVKIKQQAFFR